MVAEFLRRGREASHDSLEALALDVIGASKASVPQKPRPNEKQNQITLNTRAQKNRVVKAMCADWWIGFDKDNNHVQDLIRNSVEVDGMTIKYKIQKNSGTMNKLRSNQIQIWSSVSLNSFCQ
jgi:hypothetical protein